MALSESALKKFTKDELVNMVMDHQKRFTETLSNINKEIGELRKKFETLETDLVVARNVNNALQKQITFLQRKCWSNEQYSRRECLEIVGVPESVEPDKLEEKMSCIFSKLNVTVQAADIEACHWIQAKKGPKKVIVKLSRRKDAEEIRKARKKLKSLNLSSIGIESPIYINDSLCVYYKKLWAKCKNLWEEKYINGFWVSNGSIRLKITENGKVHIIGHDADLEELFPDNELIKDEKSD